MIKLKETSVNISVEDDTDMINRYGEFNMRRPNTIYINKDLCLRDGVLNKTIRHELLHLAFYNNKSSICNEEHLVDYIVEGYNELVSASRKIEHDIRNGSRLVSMNIKLIIN